MNREKELLERIRYLEEVNSQLQDKLDMIYSILAPEDVDDQGSEDNDADDDEDEDDEPQNLVQIQLPPKATAHKIQQIPTNQSPKRT